MTNLTTEEIKIMDWLRRHVGFGGVVRLIERLQRGTDPCGWQRESGPDGDEWFSTGCDGAYNFSAGDWRENNYRFCPGCGGKIIEVGEEPARE